MKTTNLWNNLQPSYIREILQATSKDGVISLAGGLPATDLLPAELLVKALAESGPEHYQYGPSEGDQNLRNYLRQNYALNNSQDVIITSGSQQGLDLIARTFLDHTSEIVMEQPCYLGALQVFQLTGCKIHSVQQYSEGPDLDHLEHLFRSRKIKLFYTVPDFHNPTGICWSEANRIRVAALCEKYGVALIEDSPYRELRFIGDDLPMLNQICPDITLNLRSFSKSLSPGIRLGSLSGPVHWIESITRLKQAADLHTATPFQAVLPDLLQSEEYAEHLQRLKNRYCKSYNALFQRLSELRGDHQVAPVCGGMFLWLSLAQGNASRIADLAMSQGLAVVPGKHFYPDGNIDNALRLNFSHASIDQLISAVNVLEQCLAQ